VNLPTDCQQNKIQQIGLLKLKINPALYGIVLSRISSRIVSPIQNWFSLWTRETQWYCLPKKTEGRKISWHCPLKVLTWKFTWIMEKSNDEKSFTCILYCTARRTGPEAFTDLSIFRYFSIGPNSPISREKRTARSQLVTSRGLHGVIFYFLVVKLCKLFNWMGISVAIVNCCDAFYQFNWRY
jgi:hypothetical protein